MKMDFVKYVFMFVVLLITTLAFSGCQVGTVGKSTGAPSEEPPIGEQPTTAEPTPSEEPPIGEQPTTAEPTPSELDDDCYDDAAAYPWISCDSSEANPNGYPLICKSAIWNMEEIYEPESDCIYSVPDDLEEGVVGGVCNKVTGECAGNTLDGQSVKWYITPECPEDRQVVYMKAETKVKDFKLFCDMMRSCTYCQPEPAQDVPEALPEEY